MFLKRQRLGAIILFLSDLVILFLFVVLATFIRGVLPKIIPSLPEFLSNLPFIWWFFPVWMTILIYEGAYTKKFTAWDEVKLLWKVSFFSTLAVLTIISLGKLSSPFSRTFILLIGILSIALFPPLRIAVKHLLVRMGLLKSKVLILSANDTGKRALKALRREPNLGYEVIGFVDDNQSKKNQYIDGVKVHRYLDKIERYLKHCDIQNIVIALSDIEQEKLSHLINSLQHKVKSVLYVPDYSGMAVIGTDLRHFFHDQFFAVEINNNLARPLNYFIKKVFDYSVGFILFLLFMIPILIIAALIKATSPGPALHRQRRLGKNGKPFMCYKFRTMYEDADERLERILETDTIAKAEWEYYWKLKNDPRVTKTGKFLRKTSLDEVPQIFNVLKGEMSLVGPRPYLPREWDALKEHREIIHSVQPGITGLWQVSGRSDSSCDQRISLDSWYVRNWNLWLDIVILLKTVYVVLKQEGAQ